MAKKVALISCVGKKLSFEAPAQELYCSAWFIKATVYAGQIADCWFILSAKYGLISPTRVIRPYDMTLNKMSAAQRREWAGRVFTELCPVLEPGDEVIFLAGENYRKYLIDHIKKIGVMVRIPMEGLGIGQQLSWLNQHIGRK